jgi:hypothetical protein
MSVISRFAEWWVTRRGRTCWACKTYVPDADRRHLVLCSDECVEEYNEFMAL